MVARPNAALAQIHTQIMWSRLIAVVEEQAQTMLRTAFSTPVREAGDLSAGVFDRQGRMLAQAVTGTPGHVNSMAESVRHFIRHFPLDQMQPGDAYITNDPWMGTGHLNDFVVTTPAFKNGRLVALFSCTSHLMDIGGIGFGPDGTDVFMEGLYIPMLKLIDAAIDQLEHWNVEAFHEHVGSVRPKADAADIHQVAGAGEQRDQPAVLERRRGDDEIIEMAGAHPGIVGDVGIARLHLIERKMADEVPDRLGHRVDMTRRAGHRLRQHATLPIEH